MQRTQSLIITFFCITLFWGCNSFNQQSWIKLIPEETSMVIVPSEDISMANIGSTEYTTVLDDLIPTALQQVILIESNVAYDIDLKALALYPATATESQFIWINSSDQNLNDWAGSFYEPLSQNNYVFNGIMIHKLHIGESIIFGFQHGEWLVFSQSSVALENSFRSYTGLSRSMEIAAEPAPGQLLVNSEHLDHWVDQFANVGFRPSILNSFTGLNPASLTFEGNSGENGGFKLNGALTLRDTTRSVLIDALSSENAPITLDRYIASNSAMFAIFRLPPKLVGSMPEERQSDLDEFLISDSNTYRDLALSMNNEFAFVAFPESGLLASGEFLYLRKLESVTSFRNKIQELADQGLISRQGSSYYIQSAVLAQLIGSEMVPFRDFYLSFSRDVAVISKRRGLSEGVESDRNRRRVVYYDESYSDSRREGPQELSGLVWSSTENTLEFLSPYLTSRNNLSGLIGQYDITNMVFAKQPNSNAVNFTYQSITTEGSVQPYDELWVLPLGGEELSGSPVYANIVGSATDEIIFTTQSGSVQALAFDGTVVMEASTDNEVPIGSPVLYDWYGNGKSIIMQAAGTRIYAWNENGTSLPQFPIEIGERISAPIVVTDVLRNGIPEIIVATENRKLHVVDGRGQNVRGWPQFINATITEKPVFEIVDDTWSIWAYSQNILHSWLRNGNQRPGYPVFINSQFTSAPLIFKNNILGAAADGHIYSIGQTPDFSDSLGVVVSEDSISVRSLYVTNNQLGGLSAQENVLLRDSTGFYRSDLFITQSSNGSVFSYSPEGKLELTHSLGQPASATMPPQIIDINSDNNYEIISLAEFGRLFAWNVLTDQRIFNIPTSGMKYPVIVDLNRDGQKELIAQTREGLRCWTLNREAN